MFEAEVIFFDMDHTLINNDCDVSWKEFLVGEGLAPADSMDTADYFFDQYVKGKLNFDDFLDFQLLEFVGKSVDDLKVLSKKHFEQKVRSTIYPEAERIVKDAIASGVTVSLLTATNRVLAEPVADYLGIKNICATELEIENGVFTGKIVGEYCGSEGKIAHAAKFCSSIDVELKNARYYGDSISDRYIMEVVGEPIAVNPSDALREVAEANNWLVLKVD